MEKFPLNKIPENRKDNLSRKESVSDPTTATPIFLEELGGFKVTKIEQRKKSAQKYTVITDQLGHEWVPLEKEPELQEFVSQIASIFSKTTPIIKVNKPSGESMMLSRLIDTSEIEEQELEQVIPDIETDIVLLDFLTDDADHRISWLGKPDTERNVIIEERGYYLFDFDKAFSAHTYSGENLAQSQLSALIKISNLIDGELNDQRGYKLTSLCQKIGNLKLFMDEEGDKFFAASLEKSGFSHTKKFKKLNLTEEEFFTEFKKRCELLISFLPLLQKVLD